MEAGLYIHIPFCRKKCPYCGFYSIVYQPNPALRLVKILCLQIRQLREKYAFSTVYLGGGTPSILSIKELTLLLQELNKAVKKNVEFTIEVNPESASLEKLKLFKDLGANRISVGLQAFQDSKLKFLGRLHSVKQGVDAVKKSRQAGFFNISVDLIFGIPGETAENFTSELKKAIDLPVQHISIYNLTYEPGTPLFSRLKNREFVRLEDEVLADIYSAGVDFLNSQGFRQYEISNFARQGFICRHNLGYWSNKPYIGLGPSASSFINGRRWANISSVEDYINRVEAGRDVFDHQEILSLKERACEYAAVAVRKIEGIDFCSFEEETHLDLWEIRGREIKELLNKGLLEYKQGKKGVKITKEGLLFCDYISRSLV